MFTYRTKLVAGFAALFLFLLIGHIVDHFYISRLYHSSKKVEDALQMLDYFSRLQLALERSLMPPNDYLIHGDPAEKTNGMKLIKQVDFLFKTGVKMDLTDEEHALLKDAQPKFDDVKHLSEEIFAIENPVGNKAGSEIMKRLDASAYVVQENLQAISVNLYEKTIFAINNTKALYNLENKIYLISIFLSIAFAAIIGLSINRTAKELARKTMDIESAKREWERTFDAVSDFVTIHDKNYHIIRANKATAKKFNTTPQALIGKKCHDLFHCSPEPLPECPHKKTMEEKVPVSAELEEPCLGGIFLASTYPLINEKGELYAIVHVMKDITALKKADQRVKDEAVINKAVLTVAKLISSTMDQEAILREVVQLTPTVIKCDRCAIFLWNNRQNAFLPSAYHGLEDNLVPVFSALRFKPGEFKALDEVKTQRTTLVIEDPINSPLMPSELVNTFKIRSNVITPITSHDNVIGILAMDYTKEYHKFSHRDIAIVEGIAYQTGIALENARLYRESMSSMMELQQRMETIQVMHDIDRSILSTFNRDEILETAAFMAGRLFPADRIIVVTVDKDAEYFTYVAGFGIDLSKGDTVPFKDTNATNVISTGRTISRPNIVLDENLLPLDRHFYEQGYRSDIRVPIKVKGEIVAVLNLGSYRVAAFTPEHLSMAEALADQLAVALEHATLFSDLQELLVNTVTTLVSTIDAKSPWTRGHAERVTELALLIGKGMELNKEEIDRLRLAGLLHDIGKIGTAEFIIDKPGKLTDEEYAVVKEHPQRGAAILKPIKQFKYIIPGIAQHHEWFDGTGYPAKIKNDDIHLFGRIIAVADAYDAMTSDRPYRKSLGREKAIDEIKRCAGTQFDPVVVEAFLKAIGDGQ